MAKLANNNDTGLNCSINIECSSLDEAIKKTQRLSTLLTEVDAKLRILFTLLYGEDYEE